MRAISIMILLAGLAALGCEQTGVKGSSAPSGSSTDPGGGVGLGGDCSDGQTCAEGLACSSAEDTFGTCQPEGAPGTYGLGDECFASWECQLGLVCSSEGVCAEEGDPGTTSAGESCDEDTDCQMFLTCVDGVCQGFQPPFWVGADCAAPDDDSLPLKAYFDVGRTAGEFYRLPFPNDMDRTENGADMTGHPDPGALIPDLGDVAGEFIDMVENDLDPTKTGSAGFGTMSAVFFRFNRWPDGGSFENTENIYIVNIDPDSEDYGEKASTRFRANSARGRYICYNWLAIGPSLGRPLRPGTKYAAVITTDVRDTNGARVEPDSHFPSMLSNDSVFAPFRDYLDEMNIDQSTIAAATVFTTGEPAAIIPKLREAVLDEPEPDVEDLEKDESDSEYILFTGKYTVPFFQDGDRPFKKIEDGGNVKYDSSGMPIVQEEENVKFALTVPKGVAPENGWPIVIFAHGTGGSEMTFVDEIATPMAQFGAAVIGIEQVQHGDRRGLSEAAAALESNSPKYLFYNYFNPRAARDNNVQAAADHFQLVRLIEGFQNITGEQVLFDDDKIYFFGHSQGAQGPFLFAAHEPSVKGIILSGADGTLIESMLGKKNPIDVSAAIRLALSDTAVDSYHPLLNIVQLAFDSVDPANHARYVYREQFDEMEYPRRHVFMSYGIGDTYSPETSQLSLVKSLLLKQWPLPDYELENVDVLDELPVDHTNSFDGVKVTAVTVLYEPDGDYDGHFVMFENHDAEYQSGEFIHTMIENDGGVPTLVEPE
jgi:pimeloyl-ACP methyl ester carboxylesterase